MRIGENRIEECKEIFSEKIFFEKFQTSLKNVNWFKKNKSKSKIKPQHIHFVVVTTRLNQMKHTVVTYMPIHYLQRDSKLPHRFC